MFEARAAAGESGEELRRPIPDDDPALVDEDMADPHRNRVMPEGARSWSKGGHLERIIASGYFGFTRELMFSQAVPGGAERFVALMSSQGSYQALKRVGMSDEDIGETQFRRDVEAAFRDQSSSGPIVLMAGPPRHQGLGLAVMPFEWMPFGCGTPQVSAMNHLAKNADASGVTGPRAVAA